MTDAQIGQWGNDFKRSELIALDAETTSVSVTFIDGTSVSFDSDLLIPEDGWDAVNNIVHMLENIADK